MGGAVSGIEMARIEDVLRAQWLHLRTWIHELDQDARTVPSVLAGWTVEDLVAHVGRAMDTLAAAQPSPPGTVPLTLGEYVGSYPDRAREIAEITHDLAVEIRDDPLPAVDRMVDEALAQLTVLRDLGPDPVVQARRGPILLSEMVLSRLIELVVHADDLARSTRRSGPGPVLPDALALVAETLLEIAVDRGGWHLEIIDPLAWVRLACGRVPFTVDALAAALRPTYASDSLPDLGAVLPLL